MLQGLLEGKVTHFSAVSVCDVKFNVHRKAVGVCDIRFNVHKKTVSLPAMRSRRGGSALRVRGVRRGVYGLRVHGVR